MKRNSFSVGEMHSFSRNLARQYGINAAILLAFLSHRITAVQAARKDDRGYYQTIRIIQKHYPYLSTNEINHALAKLRKSGVLKGDTHNRKAYDRTLWYTFTDPATPKLALEDPVRFRVEEAVRFGVEAALVLHNLRYWINENQKRDNRYVWHRFSPKTLSNFVPISERTIRRAVLKLCQGPNPVLERRRIPGFDQAYEYRPFSAQTTERPNSEYDRPESQFHRPNSQMERPESEMQRPKCETYTTLEDTFEKTLLGKNLLEEPVKEHIGFASVCAFDQLSRNAETMSSSASSAPAISASGQNRGRNEPSPAHDSERRGCSDLKPSPFKLTLPPQSVNEAPEKPEVKGETPEKLPPLPFNQFVYGVPYNVYEGAQITREEMAAYEERQIKFASPYESQEGKADLTPDQKMRVFKAAIYSRIKIGSQNMRTPYGVRHSSKTFETAKRFFELNPWLTVNDVMSAIDHCSFLTDQASPQEEGKYDEFFFERRSSNLDFFFKHLPQICARSGETVQIDGCTFLDEEGGDRNIYNKTLAKITEFENCGFRFCRTLVLIPVGQRSNPGGQFSERSDARVES